MYQAYGYTDSENVVQSLLDTDDFMEFEFGWSGLSPVLSAASTVALASLETKRADYIAAAQLKGLSEVEAGNAVDTFGSGPDLQFGFTMNDELAVGHGVSAVKAIAEGLAPGDPTVYADEWNTVGELVHSAIGVKSAPFSLDDLAVLVDAVETVFGCEIVSEEDLPEGHALATDITYTEISVYSEAMANNDPTFHSRHKMYAKNLSYHFVIISLHTINETSAYFASINNGDSTYTVSGDSVNIAWSTAKIDQLSGHRGRVFNKLLAHPDYSIIKASGILGTPTEDDAVLKSSFVDQDFDTETLLLGVFGNTWTMAVPVPFLDEFAMKTAIDSVSTVVSNGGIRWLFDPDRIFVGAHTSSISKIYENLGLTEEASTLLSAGEMIRGVVYNTPITIPSDIFKETDAYKAQLRVATELGEDPTLHNEVIDATSGTTIADLEAHINNLGGETNMSVSHVQVVPNDQAIDAMLAPIVDWKNTVVELTPIVSESVVTGTTYAFAYDGTTVTTSRDKFESIFQISNGNVTVISTNESYSVDTIYTAVYGTAVTSSMLDMMQTSLTEAEVESNNYDWQNIFGLSLYPDLSVLTGDKLLRGIILSECRDNTSVKQFLALCLTIAPSDAMFGVV